MFSLRNVITTLTEFIWEIISCKNTHYFSLVALTFQDHAVFPLISDYKEVKFSYRPQKYPFVVIFNIQYIFRLGYFPNRDLKRRGSPSFSIREGSLGLLKIEFSHFVSLCESFVQSRNLRFEFFLLNY